MYEFLYDSLSPEQAEAYLRRIGYEGTPALTKEALDWLVYCHQCKVPFENLDIFYKLAPIRLDAASLYEKIVERRRGGFCFELNGGFVLLLRALGFDAYSCMCRVAATRTELGNLSHRGVLVRLEGRLFFCDVGLGGPMAPFAVEVSEERQTVFGETYWIEPTYEGWYLQRRLDSQGQVGNVVIFAPQPFLPKDFLPLCQSLLSSPDSSFRTHRTVNLRTAAGHLHLRDAVLTVREGTAEEQIPFTEEELPALLAQRFSLTNIF